MRWDSYIEYSYDYNLSFSDNNQWLGLDWWQHTCTLLFLCDCC